MAEHTPTMDEIREEYVAYNCQNHDTYLTGVSMADRATEFDARFDAALAAHDAEVRAESAEAHERTKRGARTLGEIVERQIEDTLRWAGMEEQIGTEDPDQQLAWELCAEMPGKIAALEAELAEVRAGVVPEEPEWEYGACYQGDNGRELLWFSMGNGGFAIREAAEKEVERYADAQILLCRRRKAGPWVRVDRGGAGDEGDA